MTVLVPWMEILPTQQREIWPLLKPTVALGFVLYGGTAVALRLGHRQSIDFDFFIEQNLEICRFCGLQLLSNRSPRRLRFSPPWQDRTTAL